MRPLAYPDANCFLVCFSLVDKASFQNAKNAWRDELLLQGPADVPMILVGLKSDMRDDYMTQEDKRELCVTTEEAQ